MNHVLATTAAVEVPKTLDRSWELKSATKMARSTSIAAPLMVLAAAAFIVSWLGVDIYF